MAKEGLPARKVLLCGLDPSIAEELRAAIQSSDPEVEVQACAASPSDGSKYRFDFIFCSFSGSLPECADGKCAVPVVVVSRNPEAREWIEAMEAGASDYCAAPFEAAQIRWILEANSRSYSTAAA
jgi:DNA-binding NtrC family response regulator